MCAEGKICTTFRVCRLERLRLKRSQRDAQRRSNSTTAVGRNKSHMTSEMCYTPYNGEATWRDRYLGCARVLTAWLQPWQRRKVAPAPSDSTE